MRREQADFGGAEECFRQLLSSPEAGDHFASVDTGLKGYKARHNLALVCQEQGRSDEAKRHWHAAVSEQPGFAPGWSGLAELGLAERRWEDLEQAVRGLEKAGAGMDARVFRARRSLAQEDFAAARRILDETVAHFPHELWPRRILSHVLLQEGRDWAAAARALRDVLALDPRDTEAQNNLNVLLQQHAAEVSEPRNDLRPVP